MFAVALAVQTVSASYYALFFTIFVGMWLVWFIRPRAWRDALAIVTTAGVSALVLLPIVLGYLRIHESHNLTRDFAEVLIYSADVSSFVTASAVSALWGWTAPLNGGERQLFPGLTITALAVLGTIVSRRFRAAERDSLSAVSTICVRVRGADQTLELALPFEMEGIMGRDVDPSTLRHSRTAGDPVAEKESASSCPFP